MKKKSDLDSRQRKLVLRREAIVTLTRTKLGIVQGGSESGTHTVITSRPPPDGEDI